MNFRDILKNKNKLRTICAYCGNVMKDGPMEPVSHGICKICMKKEMKRFRKQGS